MRNALLIQRSNFLLESLRIASEKGAVLQPTIFHPHAKMTDSSKTGRNHVPNGAVVAAMHGQYPLKVVEDDHLEGSRRIRAKTVLVGVK